MCGTPRKRHAHALNAGQTLCVQREMPGAARNATRVREALERACNGSLPLGG
ncbi:MAG: hypothetical protein ACRENS_00055 [Candidatus Eiseniibacteriota bacterium]